ncbi:uncharacterized protein [Chelonus insularis]|uniref:uncharacterized protein isoform X2 n=1 Tax=Chelonus insularis TaxID=460826 RepID=UPI001589B058|nr:uncharacterized protein LOC118073541 isoform X2 [Chelonus insularis]
MFFSQRRFSRNSMVKWNLLSHLTEGKLALWKSDLSRSQTWSLWTFVEGLNRAPEEHVVSNITHNDQEPVSDSGSWGTDWEDYEDDDDSSAIKKHVGLRKNGSSQRSTGFRNSLMVFQNHEKLAQNQKQSSNVIYRPESIYMNYNENDSTESKDEETMYMNLEEEEQKMQKNPNKNLNQFEQTLSEQLKEHLKLRSIEKPALIKNKVELPDKSEIQLPEKPAVPARPPKFNSIEKKEIKKPASPPPRIDRSPVVPERPDDLPKPPVMIRNFDLVANLPTKTNESDDEYEDFDAQIIEQNRLKVESNQSLIKRSVESLYKPPSTTSQEKEAEEDCEDFYESITENVDDNNYYIQPISQPVRELPQLPVNPNTSDSTVTLSKTSLSKIQNKNERSPDKKSATLPHPGSSTSLSAEMRATRPLPPPPFGQSYINFSWFHNVTREQATTLIQERAYSNVHNGYFLIRPSTSDINSPLVLVVWLKDRVYNVPIRKRTDNRFALGSPKLNEKTFINVDEIITYYSKEELILYSSGKQMGSTKLTDSPPK